MLKKEHQKENLRSEYRKDKNKKRDKRKLNKYILKTSVDLEVHPFKSEDFTEDNPFIKEILLTGRKIV